MAFHRGVAQAANRIRALAEEDGTDISIITSEGRTVTLSGKPSGATVDTQTGEVLSDHETLDKLAAHERNLADLDEQIGVLMNNLKALKEARELSVAHMRKLIRREPLPLFESPSDA